MKITLEAAYFCVIFFIKLMRLTEEGVYPSLTWLSKLINLVEYIEIWFLLCLSFKFSKYVSWLQFVYFFLLTLTINATLWLPRIRYFPIFLRTRKWRRWKSKGKLGVILFYLHFYTLMIEIWTQGYEASFFFLTWMGTSSRIARLKVGWTQWLTL